MQLRNNFETILGVIQKKMAKVVEHL